MSAADRVWSDFYLVSVPDAIVAIDEDQSIVLFNEAAEKIFGYGAAEVLGRPLGMLLPRRSLALHRRHVAEFAADPEPARLMNRRGEIAARRKDGREFPAEASIAKARWEGRPVLVAVLRDLTPRKAAEEAARRSEARAQALIRDAAYGICRLTPAGRFLEVNPALVRMLGYDSAQDVLALDPAQLYTDAAERQHVTRELSVRERVDGLEVGWRRRDGRTCTFRMSARVVRGADGTPESVDVIAEDVTERRRLEDELRQAHKTEAIGRLAGGVAHDFNNLLTVIIGRAQRLADSLGNAHPDAKTVDLILGAATRAAALTQQLLAFSRRQVLQPNPVNFNTVVHDMSQLLRRTIGEHIELAAHLDPDLGTVRADRTQIEQVLLNLVLNARDAMPHGGRLDITTENLDAPPGGECSLSGPLVALRVRDTGVGMDDDTRGRIFEPFFTTKGIGRGTGLGLATVHAIVTQHGGDVIVSSEPGRGSTFTVALPRITADVADDVMPPVVSVGSGGETILVVEDDRDVRELTVEMLGAAGYQVLSAARAADAVELVQTHRGPLDLLVTDVVMPGGSGLELAQRLAGLRRELRVLFVSGYPVHDAMRHDSAETSATFLPKPFTRERLLRSVRTALGDEPAP